MNSLMSTRIRCSSLSNRNIASALHSSVLPTPVGPRNRNEPVGRFGSDRPERERRMALATALIASSWPTTRSCSRPSISSSFSRSPCISLDTGMPVARATTSAISSAPTIVRSSCGRPPSLAFLARPDSLACASFRLLLQLRQAPVLQLGDLVEVALAGEFLDLAAHLVDLFLDLGRALGRGLLGLPDFLQVGDFLLQPGDLFLDAAPTASCEASSFSLRMASRSICSWISRRSSRSMASGFESISILIFDAASSIRSIALSGRKRSVM